MKKTKRLLAGVLAVMLMGLTACSQSTTEESSSQKETFSSGESSHQTGSSEETGNYPVAITTHNYAKEKVEITFEKAPEKVICYELNSLENMIALGLQDKIILAMGVQQDEVLEEYQEDVYKRQSLL